MASIQAERDVRIANVLATLKGHRLSVRVDGTGPHVTDESMRKLAEAAVDAVSAADAKAAAEGEAGRRARSERLLAQIDEGHATPR